MSPFSYNFKVVAFVWAFLANRINELLNPSVPANDKACLLFAAAFATMPSQVLTSFSFKYFLL